MDGFSNAHYGAPGQQILPQKEMSRPMGARKGRMNFLSLATALFIPWLLFYVTCWTTSFYVHYERSFIWWFVVFCGFATTVFSIGIARQALWRRSVSSDNMREPTWYVFLATTMTAAWLSGILIGCYIYYGSMEPYYDISNLAEYPSVDPVSYQGQQLMDAGRVMFSKGTKIDIAMSAGFRNKEVYCVAPIVSSDPEHTKLASYDFWAVGKDCCTTTSPDFHCGDYHNPNARGGLRVMNDDERPYYGLAVQQAVSANGIQARMPIFFTWLEDPLGKVKDMQESGYKKFMFAIMVYFSVQLTVTVVAALAFVRHGFGYS